MKKQLLALLMIIGTSAWAQQPNIAPNAVVTATGASATLPPSAINDLNFGTCGTQQMWISTSTPPSSVIGVDWIQWDWTIPQAFDEMTIHHGSATTRFMTGFLMQYWDGTAWINGQSFTGLPMQCISHVTFPRMVTNRMRITRIEMMGTGQLSNPNFREIEIWQASTAINDAGVTGTNQVPAVCPGSYPVQVTVQNFGLNRIDSVMIHWEMNGVPQPSVNYTTQLDTLGGTGLSNALVTLGNYTFAPNQNYLLRAWTSMPNNTVDTATFNDTLQVLVALGAPTGLAAGNLTSKSADISWTSITGTAYGIIYGPTGFNPLFSGTLALPVTSVHTIQGLSPVTTYDVYLLASCGSSVFSDTAGPVTFSTLIEGPAGVNCPSNNPVTVLTEEFDVIGTWTGDIGTGSTAGDWNINSGQTTSLNTGPAGAHSGTNYIYYESGGAGPASLVSPPIDLSAATDSAELSFWMHAFGASIGYLKVNVSTTSAAGPFNQTLFNYNQGQLQNSMAAPWQEVGVRLDQFVGQVIWLEFEANRISTFTGDIAIDLVQVKTCGNLCLPPDSLNVTALGDTTATLGWANFTNAGSYQIWYGPQGFFQGTQTQGAYKAVTTVNSIVIDTLSALTCYEFVVRSICGPLDSSLWEGPFIFCTSLGYDAELVQLLIPSGCGSGASTVEAVIRNNGDNDISNFPVTVNLTGTHTNSFSTTYPGTLGSGLTDTLLMGTINTANGALISYAGHVGFTKDQITANDSLLLDSIVAISLDPIAYDTAFCMSQDTAVLSALPIPGVSYNWFANMTDPTPLFTGNPFYVPTSGAQSTYYVEYANNADSLSTSYAGGNGQAGNAFDIMPLTSLDITGMSINADGAGSQTVDIYFRTGTYAGSATTLTGWTLHQSTTLVVKPVGNPTRISFATPFSTTANQVYGVMVVITSAGAVDYTNGSVVGAILAQNSDLIIYEGSGISWPLGSNFMPRFFNGAIHYGGQGCSTNRLPVNLTLGNDTATAAFAVSGTIDSLHFDASASVNADHYAWDFGDGNSGSGVTTSHRYLANGIYTVTLTVSDTTDCFSTDVLQFIATVNIGLAENVLQQSLLVYPNPSTGKVNISLESPEGKEVIISVTDLSGKEVLNEKAPVTEGKTDHTLDIAHLADGVYMLRISAGGLQANKRLIKQ